MDLNAGECTDVGQGFLHMSPFVLKLSLVLHVLPLAAPANAEVRTGGLDSVRRGIQEFLHLCFGIGLFLSEDQGVHPVPGDSALDKNHQPVHASDSLAAECDAVNGEIENGTFLRNLGN